MDLVLALFEGWLPSGGRMDRGRMWGSGFTIMCDGIPPCDTRVGCAGGQDECDVGLGEDTVVPVVVDPNH